MFGIARKTVDSAGGAQIAGGQDWVTCEGEYVVLLGDPVQGHGPPPHAAPTMVQGSSWITIDGIPVCREGHAASCGHPSTGSSFAFSSD
jgi:uncharacterized Zn-binding protein involved in type VI secretion